MKLQIFLFSLWVMGAYCALMTEITQVTEEERGLGYSCKSADENVGLMKEGEVRPKYNPNACGKVACYGGEITFTTCGLRVGPPGCKYIPDSKLPYPECCKKMDCV